MFKYFFSLALMTAVAANVTAQNVIGNGSVNVASTPDGSVTWSVTDGSSRKGYLDKNFKSNISETKNDEVIIPVSTYMYPMDATDILFFSGNGVDTYTVVVMDEKGNIVAGKESVKDDSMDISSFQNGTYILKMKRGVNGKVYTKKIVKN